MDSMFDERLSRITTLWSLVQRAHAKPGDAAAAARRELLGRYCGAVYRYLLGALRNEDAAQEVFQEFALRFVRGDLHRADPARGRFRDYVKTAVIHLVYDHRAEQRRSPQPLPPDFPSPNRESSEHDEAAAFIQNWREELIERTWELLAKANPNYHAVLLMHVQNPDMSSREIADSLTTQSHKEHTGGGVRVTLHRAREKFADLLIDEVAHSLTNPTESDLIDELRLLGLLKLCAPALERKVDTTQTAEFESA
jgi:RNA polymerase sigma factor (sigma-70 family)